MSKCWMRLSTGGLARLLRWLLRKYHHQTIAILAGFMLGSVRKLWPWKLSGLDGLELANTLPAELTLEVGAALLLMLAGFAVALLVEYLPSRRVLLSQQRGAEME